MKKRAARLAVLLLMLPVTLFIFAFALPPQYGNTYLAALNGKAAALRETASPKIVLIGGSGAAFDVDCELLKNQLPGYEAVNFGLYAGLGTTVMLELALPDIHAGDIVVFSPELSQQTLSDWFGAESMWQAAEENPKLLLRLDASRWGKLLAAFPYYAAQKAHFFLEGSAPAGEGVYARSAFTPLGDIQPGLRPANRMPGGWDENLPLIFEPALPTEDFFQRVNAFASACEQRGAQMIFRFCPMNAAALAPEEEANIEAFEARLGEKLNCPVIGSARDALMEPGWFFDTNFHLNGAGATVHTAKLAKDIKLFLGDASPVTISLPEMPPLETIEAKTGNNQDEDYFLFERIENGWHIIGLTDTGKIREKLTVPVSHDGLPVLSFAATTFAGNERLRELEIQSNIRFLPDGALEGCAALKTIFLDQPDPGQCTVGRELLRGTDASVAVPTASYAAYCTNYFWSPYASRLIPAATEESPAVSPAPTATPQTVQRKVTKIRYEGNGGTLRGQAGESLSREITYVHQRENTLPGTMWFQRDGFVLTGWNTEADGSGRTVGLGSRVDPEEGSALYAQWLPCSPEEDFDWEADSGKATITGYHGPGGVCVLPMEHEGLPVRAIQSGAFQGKAFSVFVFSPNLRQIGEGAFADCSFGQVILYDSLEAVSDACFRQCEGPETLRVNAATTPRYSGTYFDTFPDKYDALLSLKGRKKLALSSGSSGRYGYDSTLLAAAFPEYAPVNMGVYAFTNALPQLRLMLPLLEAGDLLLYAPEFDAVQEQFCVTNRLDSSFWPMMEGNYDLASSLDMREFSGVFDSLDEYLRVRAKMPGKSYEVSPAQYDDDGNFYPFNTYNAYGDFVLPRPNGGTDERLRHNIADYTVSSFPMETIQSLNAALTPFVEKGVTVLFTYTPRNVNSLTEASTPEARQVLDEWLRENLSVPVISEIEDSLLPGRYFWLIDSHTSTEGARIRTERVIEDLRTWMDLHPNEPGKFSSS